jgi:hypothetical protein
MPGPVDDLDREDPGVRRLSPRVLSKASTTPGVVWSMLTGVVAVIGRLR